MSDTKKVALIVTAVLVVCLIGAGIVIMIAYGGSFPNIFVPLVGTAVTIDESEPLRVDGANQINIDSVIGKVIIQTGQPRAELTGNVTTNVQKDKYLIVKREGGTLAVRFDANTSYPGYVNGEVTMRIWLPESLQANVCVTGASANIEVCGLSFENMTLKSASGAVSVTDCSGGLLSANSVSGAVRVENANFERTEIGCTSGGVVLEGASGDVKINNISGAVRLTDVAGAVYADNVSGSVYLLQQHKDIKQIRIGTVSGSVQCVLHERAAFDLSAKSTSGNLATNFDIMVSGEFKNSIVGEDIDGAVNGGGVSVSLTTVSGSIRVDKR